MFEILLAILLGVASGIITGLTPGLHTNTLAVLMLAIAVVWPFSLLSLAVILIAMSIVHTIIDAIPSIFLGAPDGSMVVSALPGHKMLLDGRGLHAVMLTVVGSLGAVLWSIVFVAMLIFVFPIIAEVVSEVLFWILLAVLVFLFIQERKRFASFLVFCAAGMLGWSVLHIEFLEQPLFSMLSGLFGVSLLWCSLDDAQQDVRQQEERFCFKGTWYVTLLSCIAGVFAAFLPGIGSAQVAILAQKFCRGGDEGFLMLTGGINTAGMFVSLITFYVLDKARNGSIVALQQLVGLEVGSFLLLLAVMAVSAGVAALLVRPLSKVGLSFLQRIGISRVTVAILVTLIGLAVIFDGVLGLLVLGVATLLGIVVQRAGLPKHYLMACLLFPVLLYFWPF